MPRRPRRLYANCPDELKQWTRPDHHLVEVTKVSDGDTIHVSLQLGFGITLPEVRVRMLGIQAPELIGTEKHQGHHSRRELAKLILNQFVGLETYRDQTGRYGRELGIIWKFCEPHMVNVNQWMIDNDLAKPLKVNRFFDARPEHMIPLFERCEQCNSFIRRTHGQVKQTNNVNAKNKQEKPG